MIVHLPIGMLCLAFFLELYQWRKPRLDLRPAISFTLQITLIAAFLSVLTGWFLSEEGGYDEDTLFWHQWLGIGMTALLALICLLRWRSRKANTVFPLFVALLLLTGAGHYGGSLTHGEDYLFSSGEGRTPVVEDIQKAMVFESIIQPILQQKCMSCHNPSKAKGELVMTNIEGLKAGGKTGALLDFDDPMKSAMLARIHLPESEKKHMPPSGKKQLTEDEIALLEWWLINKACFDCKISETIDQGKVQLILDKYKKPVAAQLKDLPPLTSKQLTVLAEANIPAQQLAVDNPYLIVNLADRKDLDKNTFRALRKVSDYVLELNLQHSNFSDQLASWLPSFSQLQKLQLQHTGISNKGVTYLKELDQLNSLNIYGTELTDEIIPELEALPALQHLYCYQSKMSSEGVLRLQKAKPMLDIQYRIDEGLFGGAKLNPPKILYSNDLFADTLQVRLSGAFKGASIFYTLDGSEPDSASLLYQDSILLTKTTTLKVYCYKEGWESSSILTKYFRKRGVVLKSVKLSAPPNKEYAGKGGLTLVDFQQGSNDIKDGNWLGYQGEDVHLIAELDSAQVIRQIALSALSAPGPWVFFPKGLKVAVSIDGKNYTTVGEEKYKMEQEGIFRDHQYFEIDFEPRPVRFFKMEIISEGKNPSWHPNAGENCWLFVDEVVAE